MKNTIIPLLLTCAFAFGCAGTPARKPAEGTVYYFGQVRYSSVDGKQPYGGTTSAVMREVLAGGDRIIETVTQPGRSPATPSQTFVTRITRRDHALVYDAADDEKTFTGSLTFSGPDLAAWAYDIKLASGALTGSGRLTAAGIATDKTLAIARPVRITEDLRVVTKAEYEAQIAGMRPSGQ